MISGETSAHTSFRHSVLSNKLQLTVSRLAEGDSWDGVYDKLLQLKEVLEPDKNDDSLVVLFADGYDVLFNGAAEEILERFTKFNASIVFSAEKACFPRFYCSRYVVGLSIDF